LERSLATEGPPLCVTHTANRGIYPITVQKRFTQIVAK